MAEYFQLQRRVEFSDTDAAGVMHFSTFFLWMEQAEHALLRHCGLTVFPPRAHNAITWPRVSAHADFRHPVSFEDVVAVHVRVKRIGSRSVTYQFDFHHADRVIAEGTMTAACCLIPEHEKPLRSVDIPEAFRQALQPYLID
jgi:4-hydroxybenzoyl-CoA thioesterase/acyl-CoA thioester hydrolase